MVGRYCLADGSRTFSAARSCLAQNSAWLEQARQSRPEYPGAAGVLPSGTSSANSKVYRLLVGGVEVYGPFDRVTRLPSGWDCNFRPGSGGWQCPGPARYCPSFLACDQLVEDQFGMGQVRLVLADQCGRWFQTVSFCSSRGRWQSRAPRGEDLGKNGCMMSRASVAPGLFLVLDQLAVQFVGEGVNGGVHVPVFGGERTGRPLRCARWPRPSAPFFPLSV